MRNCQSRRLQRRISDGKCFHGIRAYQNLSGFCFGSCLVQRSLRLHCRTDWRKRCRKKHNHQCRFRIDPLCCPCVLWYGYNASLVVIVWLYRDKRYPAGRRRQPAVAYLSDPEKSQIVFMMSFMASTGIITGLVLLINLVFPVKENILLAFHIVLIISVIWFFVSYRIAVKVYRKRDIN